ncbi:MAG TPA: c-type cytochrome [Ottowia sp.]|nr:c-type cytochrome [Ottowia sp.]
MTRLAPLLILFTAMAAQAAGPAPRERIERGRYLINATGCMDCHTPLKNGPRGPEPDRTRLFAGHPEALAMPPAPALPAGPWLVVVSATNTAWAGPWGVSYTANLTPDPDTGLGRWSAQDFLRTMRSGRHLGAGRPLLPPMPAAYGQMSDEDLQAMFAYLQTLPPVRNRVPAPLPPAAR